MRDLILRRLACLADVIIQTKRRGCDCTTLARAAESIARTHHPHCPPAEGSP